MAQKIQTLFIDDIDGGEAEGTVRFALDGSEYEIDLNAKHSEELRSALAKYVTHARKVGAPARRGSARGSRKPATLDTVAVRTWARENGMGIKERGRVPAEVVAQYQAAVGSLQALIQGACTQPERISLSIRIGQTTKRCGRRRK